MTQETINRYQPGGDIYAELFASYGQAGADQIAFAAQGGDATDVNAALVNVKFGQPLNDSTLGNFLQQISTDPLAAPIESANGVLKNTVASLFKNPLVPLALLAVAFFALGGANLIRRKLS